jgi:hypothetical protein
MFWHARFWHLMAEASYGKGMKKYSPSHINIYWLRPRFEFRKEADVISLRHRLKREPSGFLSSQYQYDISLGVKTTNHYIDYPGLV